MIENIVVTMQPLILILGSCFWIRVTIATTIDDTMELSTPEWGGRPDILRNAIRQKADGILAIALIIFGSILQIFANVILAHNAKYSLTWPLIIWAFLVFSVLTCVSYCISIMLFNKYCKEAHVDINHLVQGYVDLYQQNVNSGSNSLKALGEMGMYFLQDYEIREIVDAIVKSTNANPLSTYSDDVLKLRKLNIFFKKLDYSDITMSIINHRKKYGDCKWYERYK